MNCLIISTSFTLQPVLASIWNAPVGYQKESLFLCFDSQDKVDERKPFALTRSPYQTASPCCVWEHRRLFSFSFVNLFLPGENIAASHFHHLCPGCVHNYNHWLCWQLQSDCNLPGQMGSILHSCWESPPTNILQGVWGTGWVISWRRDENQGH